MLGQGARGTPQFPCYHNASALGCSTYGRWSGGPMMCWSVYKNRVALGTAAQCCILAFGIIQGAYAQAPTPTATTKLCGQKVDYTLAPPSPDVSTDLNKYLGVWSGHVIGVQSGYNVEYEMCVAYEIERITADATVYTQRINRDKSIDFPYGV